MFSADRAVVVQGISSNNCATSGSGSSGVSSSSSVPDWLSVSIWAPFLNFTLSPSSISHVSLGLSGVIVATPSSSWCSLLSDTSACHSNSSSPSSSVSVVSLSSSGAHSSTITSHNRLLLGKLLILKIRLINLRVIILGVIILSGLLIRVLLGKSFLIGVTLSGYLSGILRGILSSIFSGFIS